MSKELYTPEQLERFPEFDNLRKALKKPKEVVRLTLSKVGKPADLAKVGELQSLQSLSVSQVDVSYLLPQLSKLSHLQDLSFQACSIAAFPEVVLTLRNLRSLNIGNCGLTEIPAEIECLELLAHCWFSQNELCRLPSEFGRLHRLQTLSLAYNQIEELPDSFAGLRILESLSLDCNRLKVMPDWIGSLDALQYLSIKNNDLSRLPQAIGNLKCLETLYLEHNPFKSLPSCLDAMPRLKTLGIEGQKRKLFMDWSYIPSSQLPVLELEEMDLFVTPQSDLYDGLARAVLESGVPKHSDWIFKVARSAIAIETVEPDDFSILGRSRFGGFPDLPDAALFPTTDGQYWSFLAQINLGELSTFNRFLPRSGLLSFFVESTETFRGRVLLYQGDFSQLKTTRHSGADVMFDDDDDYTENPHTIAYHRFVSLPHYLPFATMDDDDDEYDAYSSCKALHPSVEHHLNGYTFTQNESPQQVAANKLRGDPDEWVPLLKLGFDKKVGFCFWDAGTLTFCIHQEDLRRLDFSRVHVSLETS